MRNEPASVGVSGLPSAKRMLARMELGMPPLSPLTPRTTRSHTIASNNESDSSSVSDGEGGGSGGARVSAPASLTHHSGSDSASEAPLDHSSDDSSNGKSISNDDERGEFEVDSILRYRRVGRKRTKYEFLTRWVGGEETWEPSSSFKLDAPDVESHSHYLPVYDEYKTRMNEGKENEDNGEMNMDGGGDSGRSIFCCISP